MTEFSFNPLFFWLYKKPANKTRLQFTTPFFLLSNHLTYASPLFVSSSTHTSIPGWVLSPDNEKANQNGFQVQGPIL